MSFVFRVAGLAVVPFVAALGLTGVGAPGRAQEVPALSPLQVQNVPQAAPVPAVAVATTQNDPIAAPAPQPGFASLEEAVAATGTDAVSPEEAHCLAVAIYYEAKSEPLAGQLAVANVVINRTKSHRFPGSVCSVVKQAGQFSFVHGGRLPEAANGHQFRVADAVARVALAGAWENPAPNALFFHASRISLAGHQAVARIGNHVFYR